MVVLIIVETLSLHIVVSTFFLPLLQYQICSPQHLNSTVGVLNVLKCVLNKYTFSAGILHIPLELASVFVCFVFRNMLQM
jgi:hypothetical protein